MNKAGCPAPSCPPKAGGLPESIAGNLKAEVLPGSIAGNLKAEVLPGSIVNLAIGSVSRLLASAKYLGFRANRKVFHSRSAAEQMRIAEKSDMLP